VFIVKITKQYKKNYYFNIFLIKIFLGKNYTSRVTRHFYWKKKLNSKQEDGQDLNTAFSFIFLCRCEQKLVGVITLLWMCWLCICGFLSRRDHFRFGLVFAHKKQLNREKKQTRNRTETGPNRPVPVRFLMPKTEKPICYFELFLVL